MIEEKNSRQIYSEISPELFEERERKKLTLEKLNGSDAAWAYILLTVILGERKLEEFSSQSQTDFKQ